MEKACLPKAVSFFIACLLLLVSFTGSLYAEPVALSSEPIPTTIFGPKEYIRSTASPNVYLDTFPAQAGAARIVLKNGAEEGSEILSSAFIYINGVEIFGPADFNQKAYTLESPVTLTGNDTIKVVLESHPGTYLSVEIIQELIPVAVSLSAEPQTINVGEATTLLWSTTNADTVVIDQGIGSVPTSGSMQVSPTMTTTYTITASSLVGTAATANVTVTVTYPLPTISFSATPLSIELGSSAILDWSTNNAEDVTISPDIGTVSSSGSMSVSPVEETTYIITATGPGGTTTDQVVITVTYPEPTASISAEPSTLSAGENSTLTWSTQYAQTCSIEPDIGAVPCTFELTVAPFQDTIYTLTASGQGGTVTAQAAITVTTASPITLAITSPADGDNLSRPDVQVTGTIAYAEGLETGVMVNGVIALVYGETFVANHVPLTEGENSITVKAVDENGEHSEQTIFVTVKSSARYVELYTDTESGIAPSEVTLRLDTNFNIPIQPAFSYTGPAEVEFLLNTEPNTWSISIAEPGIYFFSAETQDENGVYCSDTVAILVMDRIALDAILQAKWDRMKEALLLNQIENAVSFFLEGSQTVYKNQFDFMANAGVLSQVVNNMGAFRLVEHDGFGVVYDLRTVRDGVEYSFQVLFVQDKDGIWRIKNY